MNNSVHQHLMKVQVVVPCDIIYRLCSLCRAKKIEKINGGWELVLKELYQAFTIRVNCIAVHFNNPLSSLKKNNWATILHKP